MLAPGIASVFLLGVFWKRTTPAAGLTALSTGFVLGMTRLALTIFKGNLNAEALYYRVFVQPNWLHYEIYLFFLCILVLVVVSFFTKPASEAKLAGLTFGSISKEQRAETRASYSNWDVAHSVIIIGVILAFYIYFWN